MTDQFEKNQQRIDRLIKKINDIRWNSDVKVMETPEYRKSMHRKYRNIERLKSKQVEILKRKIKNKKFYFNPIKTSRSIYGGTYFKTPIYQQKKSGLTLVGQAKWNTASTSGEESEVLQQLVRDKILPKEVLALSRGVSSGSGYYHWGMKDTLGLKIERLAGAR